MKKLILFLLLTSCGAPYHIRRAIKKDPTIITEKVDTVRFTFNQVDTIERISNDTIYTDIIIRQVDTMFLTKYKFVESDDIKTRQQIRQEAKTERVEIRQEHKSNDWLIWIVVILCLIFGIFLIKK